MLCLDPAKPGIAFRLRAAGTKFSLWIRFVFCFLQKFLSVFAEMRAITVTTFGASTICVDLHVLSMDMTRRPESSDCFTRFWLQDFLLQIERVKKKRNVVVLCLTPSTVYLSQLGDKDKESCTLIKISLFFFYYFFSPKGFSSVCNWISSPSSWRFFVFASSSYDCRQGRRGSSS